VKVIDYHEAIFASELTSNARLTALAISKFYNWKEQEACWPSNKTLAKSTGLSIRSIIRSKNELVNSGYLVSQRRYDMSNTYIPSVPESHTICQSDTLVVSNWQSNNEYNNKYNNEINNEINQTSFDNNNQNIMTGEIFNISSETIDNPPAEFKANAAAAKIIEEDWLSW
jgi:hypothetical protein